MAFNKAILVGNLVADPELKQTPQGTSVCSFRIAVQRRFAKNNEQGQPTADFINIVAWRQTAEFVCKYFRKGKPILVCGQIQTRTWTDQQGGKRYETEVVADEVSFVESRSDRFSAESERILRSLGYAVTVTCENGIADVRRGERESLYALPRISVWQDTTAEELMAEIAYKKGS